MRRRLRPAACYPSSASVGPVAPLPPHPLKQQTRPFRRAGAQACRSSYAPIETAEDLSPPPAGQAFLTIGRGSDQRQRSHRATREHSNYAEQLAGGSGRLYLTGISSHAYDQIAQAGRPSLRRSVHAYRATAILGESTRQAIAGAQAWLVDSGAISDAERARDQNK